MYHVLCLQGVSLAEVEEAVVSPFPRPLLLRVVRPVSYQACQMSACLGAAKTILGLPFTSTHLL